MVLPLSRYARRKVVMMSTAFIYLLLIGAQVGALPVEWSTSDSALIEVTTKMEADVTAGEVEVTSQLLDDVIVDDMIISSRQKLQSAGGMEFPNTAIIPGDLTEQLSVDGFFSLWFVFLDDDVFTSGESTFSPAIFVLFFSHFPCIT